MLKGVISGLVLELRMNEALFFRILHITKHTLGSGPKVVHKRLIIPFARFCFDSPLGFQTEVTEV